MPYEALLAMSDPPADRHRSRMLDHALEPALNALEIAFDGPCRREKYFTFTPSYTACSADSDETAIR
jgi:hypothetical protein